MGNTNPELRSKQWLSENYEEIQVLGKGAQGVVLLSRSRATQQLAAIKTARIKGGHASKMTEREARFLSALRMRNIVHLEEWYTTTAEYVLVMEACDYDLCQVMDMYKQMQLKLPELFVWRLFSRIADALAFVHHNGVVHHDMKPPNILLKWGGRDVATEYPDAVLADFGAATRDTEVNYDVMAAPAYTMLYHPPDALRGPTMDVWGLGSIIHEIALYRTVVKAIPDEIRSDALAKEVWIKNPDNKKIGRGVDAIYSPELETYMFACLRFTPTNRMDSKTLSEEVRRVWKEKAQVLPFRPLERWCCETIEARAREAVEQRARGREVEDARQARQARREMGLPEPTDA